MRVRTIQRWSWVHKWTSLVSTAFLLVLCVTGLPLIFKDELDDLFYAQVEPADVPPGTPHADLDAIVASALGRYPGEVVQFIVWPRDEPNIVRLSIAKTSDADPSNNKLARFDVHSGQFLDQPDYRSRVTRFLLDLHTDLFAGLPGDAQRPDRCLRRLFRARRSAAPPNRKQVGAIPCPASDQCGGNLDSWSGINADKAQNRRLEGDHDRSAGSRIGQVASGAS
jgi:hypothetical protein